MICFEGLLFAQWKRGLLGEPWWWSQVESEVGFLWKVLWNDSGRWPLMLRGDNTSGGILVPFKYENDLSHRNMLRPLCDWMSSYPLHIFRWQLSPWENKDKQLERGRVRESEKGLPARCSLTVSYLFCGGCRKSRWSLWCPTESVFTCFSFFFFFFFLFFFFSSGDALVRQQQASAYKIAQLTLYQVPVVFPLIAAGVFGISSRQC